MNREEGSKSRGNYEAKSNIYHRIKNKIIQEYNPLLALEVPHLLLPQLIMGFTVFSGAMYQIPDNHQLIHLEHNRRRNGVEERINTKD